MPKRTPLSDKAAAQFSAAQANQELVEEVAEVIETDDEVIARQEAEAAQAKKKQDISVLTEEYTAASEVDDKAGMAAIASELSAFGVTVKMDNGDAILEQNDA